MQSNKILTSFNLKETDLYLLVGKALKTAFGLPQSTLFFEVPVGGSRADIVYVQTPTSYESPLRPGVHIFEVKMRWGSDRRRLAKQLADYSEAADYVWVVAVNGIPDTGCDAVGELVFSTNGCRIDVIRPAAHSGRVDLRKRLDILSEIASELKNKYRLVEEMAWVNAAGEARIMVQQKLPDA